MEIEFPKKMIVVLADDLTGAAEIAGLAHAVGLRAGVQTEFMAESGFDVIALDTNTRSLPDEEAAAVVADFTLLIVAAKPEWLYKKTDSLLRGPVAAEIHAILKATHGSRCLLVPANPSRQRFIQSGEMWIGNQRLHETGFAKDPEYPRLTSVIKEMIDLGDQIEVPDVICRADLELLAIESEASPHPLLLAGAADFFQALIERRKGVSAQTVCPDVSEKAGCTVLVSGSRAAWETGGGYSGAIEVLPDSLLEPEVSDQTMKSWVSQLADVIRVQKRVMIAIGRSSLQTKILPAILAERLAEGATRAIQEAECVERVLAEGGATAAAIAKAFGWTRFEVIGQPAVGVVLLRGNKVELPELMIKVGSYAWPESVWP